MERPSAPHVVPADDNGDVRVAGSVYGSWLRTVDKVDNREVVLPQRFKPTSVVT